MTSTNGTAPSGSGTGPEWLAELMSMSTEERLARSRQLLAQAEALAARKDAIKQATESARATVRSANGAVSVTVAMGGALEAITFTPKAAGMSPTMLGTTVMAAYRQAVTRAAETAVDSVGEIVGTDSPLLDHLRAAVPQFPDET